MKLSRILTPVVLIATLVVQFLPGTAISPRTVAASSACDLGGFVGDITVPDGTSFAPGATFTKTWRIKNNSSCTWTTGYSLVFLSGDAMGTPTIVPFATSVAPGATIDLSVNLTAPSVAGHYRGYYKLKDDASNIFGVGPSGSWVFFVDINVGTSYTMAYDFATNFCAATWTTGAGAVACPGTDGNAAGYMLLQATPQLENGSYDSHPGIVVAPQAVTGGYLQGTFPAFTVQAGDRFQSIVNCTYGATGCYVNFQLRYQIDSGPIQTFWNFKERYDGLYFTVNLDLSSLAGQNVKFILYEADIPGHGVPSGDRAMWSGPRIMRGGTSSGTPVILTPLPSSACDRAVFIADVTVPDGTVMAANTPFVKTWRLKNNGTCTWTTSYALVFASGDQMGATPTIYLPTSVAPGGTIDLSVTLTAPSIAGTYKGNWTLRNAAGTRFGVGTGGSYPFWVLISVTGAYTNVYDFAANACAGTWTSGAGSLPCYGTDGDSRGFVLNPASPSLEDGTVGGSSLLTFPQNVTDGYIQGIYPAFSVLSGDHFQATLSCQNGSTGCNVVYRLDYQIGGGAVTALKTVNKVLDGTTYRMDVDLSALAGQSVKFILTVQANGVPTGDRALWVTPHIARLVLSPTPGPTATSGPGADLSVTITDSASSYVAGTSVTYTVVVTNNGPLNVTGATFNDTQPAQIALAPSTGWTVSCAPDPGALCTAGPVGPYIGNITDAINIPSGKKVTYTIVANISSAATGVLSNTVTITPPDGVPDPIPANNTATDNDNPPYADLQVSLSDGVSLYTPGGSLVYTGVVFNAGPSDVSGAQVSIYLPSNTTQAATLSFSCVLDPGTTDSSGCGGAAQTPALAAAPGSQLDTVTIPAGKKITYTIGVTLLGTITSAYTETLAGTLISGTVPLGVTDPNTGNNSASDTDLPPSADLMVTLTDNSSTFTAGGTNTFVAVVTNNGPSDVVGGTFTLNKPTQVNGATWTASCTPDLGAACTPVVSPTAVTDVALNVPAGKKVTYTIIMPILNPTSGPMVVTAYVANPASLPDPVATNNTATDTDTQTP